MYPNPVLALEESKAHRREIEQEMERARGQVRYDRPSRPARSRGNLLTVILSLFLG